jgi:hypothetical protein
MAPPITPELAGNTLIVMGVVYIFTLVYSIYMAVLNHRQAKVREELKETNEILRRIEEKIK